MSGNTKTIADLIEEGLVKNGASVHKKNVASFLPIDFITYNTFIFGTFTWGNGDLPKPFQRIYEYMNTIDLSGKNFAVFGSGDSVYKKFCGAVNILENKIIEKNGHLLLNSLKIELRPKQDEIERCKQFGAAIAQMTTNKIVK